MLHQQSLPASVAGHAVAVPQFVCSCTEGGLDADWIRVAGELDVATTPQLVRTLRESQSHARLVVLDLRELAFMDCSGVNAIVDAGSRARRAGRQLLVLRAPANVDRLFSLTETADAVEFGDIAPAESPAETHQRSLVSSSLLKTGDWSRGRGA
jgi:anti-sigma B factor antagonist